MRIFIVTDLEGISGVGTHQQVIDTDLETRKLLMEDTNAAIRGAFDGGATEVIVEDGHGGGGNFIEEMLDPRAIMTGSDEAKTNALQNSADATMMIGAHAMAGTQNAFLDHTQSSIAWHDFTMNGRKHGEVGQAAIFAGAFGIPMIMVSGDLAACAEATSVLGNIKTAVVKYADGREKADCIDPAIARELIYKAAKESIALVDKIKPLRPILPMELKLEFNHTWQCDEHVAYNPDAERVDGRTLRRVIEKVETFSDVMIW